MSKMSKIDQIHLRAVMLCMLKMSKMPGKEHDTEILAHNFLNTGNGGFNREKKFHGKLRLQEAFQPYHQILCILRIITICNVSDINSITEVLGVLDLSIQHLQHALIYTVFDGMVGKPSVSACSKLFLDWKSIKY